jgi:hypothetical protein
VGTFCTKPIEAELLLVASKPLLEEEATLRFGLAAGGNVWVLVFVPPPKKGVVLLLAFALSVVITTSAWAGGITSRHPTAKARKNSLRHRLGSIALPPIEWDGNESNTFTNLCP